MKYVIGVISAIALTLVAVLMFLLYVVVASPSCAERGGVQVHNGVVVTNIMVGKVLIPQITQSYKCVISEK